MSTQLVKVSEASWRNIQNAVTFYMRHGARLLGLLRESTTRSTERFAVRGILAESIHSNGSGLMYLLERVDLPSSFMLSVHGINLPFESEFKLKLMGYREDPPSSVELFLTEFMSAALTAEELQAILRRFMDDVIVTVGNPVTLPSGNESFTGQWIITFPIQDFDSLLLTVEESTFVGLSTVVVRRTTDITSSETELVTDIFNRPPERPWQAGSIVACVPMMDTGYSIIGSDYRDISIVGAS